MILSSASSVEWLLAALTALAYALGALAALRVDSVNVSRLALAPAWALHAATLAWGLLLAGAPRFGFAPALSMTAWLVLTIYAVERELLPRMRARRALPALAALGGVAALAAVVFPGQLLPLTASPWLPLHFSLGIACYGLFAVAVVHAWLMGRAERQMRLGADSQSGLPLLTLERLTFRFVAAGFALLTATLVAGWLFGEQLYGEVWRWNHKAVFATLAWLVFATLLLGRSRFGWRGRGATRMLYAGAGLLLLAYAGTRFVLEVILHRGPS